MGFTQQYTYGQKICAKRGYSKFVEAIRPDFTTGVCPTNTVRCS